MPVGTTPKPRCEVDGCRHLSRTVKPGPCGAHFDRLRRTGSYQPDLPLRTRITGTPAKRVLARAVITPGPLPTPCLIVDGAGYDGRWRPDSKGSTKRAYVVLYEHFVGPIPDGMTLDHLCVDPSCVAVDHLDPCTGSENSRRDHERARLGAAAWLAAR